MFNMAKRWISFKLMPASWGLVGDAYLEAEAHYYLSGEALERRLLHIRLTNPEDLQCALLELDLRYGRITDYEATRHRVEMMPPGVARDLALLTVEHDHGKIADIEYQKQSAALKNEPWISIVNSGFDPEQGIDGVFFEFDWNPQWIDFLRVNGYVGRSDEQVVDDWFADVCRSYSQVNEAVPFSLSRGL
jgi:hypothetical protein